MQKDSNARYKYYINFDSLFNFFLIHSVKNVLIIILNQEMSQMWMKLFLFGSTYNLFAL